MRHFLSLADFSREEVQGLVDLARALKREPVGERLLRKVVGLLFMNPSLRTLASFQAGVGQQGGTSFVVQPGAGSWTLELEDGAVMDGSAVEHVREAIPVLASYCDILGVRSFADQADLSADLADARMRRFADLSPKPLINMESASDHPCQALADWTTLDELGVPPDGHFVLSWAWHPKPLPYAVPAAALRMAAQRGMRVTVLCPDGYALPEDLTNAAASLGAREVRTVHEVGEGMRGAHVLYCKSWCSPEFYGRPTEEAGHRAGLRDWCVKESWFETAHESAKFMHCLPVRRNVKVADEVLDGPRSAVLQQAENRLHAQKSVMVSIVQGSGPWS
ncbi:MAG: N-acetylornithine carbamoyltransferase [Fimbriimonadaceae bacterium]|nr:MAG: N-acetylornithine carbamoyltransferase [Fimbriimonadaceae bacterium]